MQRPLFRLILAALALMSTARFAVATEPPEGVVVGDKTVLTATVKAVDAAKRTVTLPGGNTRTVKVDKSVKAFDELKVGDDVVARYTEEAIAIAVRKP